MHARELRKVRKFTNISPYNNLMHGTSKRIISAYQGQYVILEMKAVKPFLRYLFLQSWRTCYHQCTTAVASPWIFHSNLSSQPNNLFLCKNSPLTHRCQNQFLYAEGNYSHTPLFHVHILLSNLQPSDHGEDVMQLHSEALITPFQIVDWNCWINQ